MKTYTYTFRPYHIIYLLVALLIIYPFLFGYECGFFEVCKDRSNVGVVVFRAIIVTVAAFFGVYFILDSEYEKEINIPMFGAEDMGPKHPFWEDFQDFLKEREENL